MMYNNAWNTNYLAEYTGKTVCEYDIYRTRENQNTQQINEITDTYLVEPVVVIHPEAAESDLYNKWLNNKP